MPDITPLVIPPTGAVPDVVTNTLIATDWGNAIGAASRGRVVQRFNSTAERDSAITAPVAGMLCYVAAVDLFYGYRTASGWTTLIGGPRDTYHALVSRAAAFTFPTVDTSMAFDTLGSDSMGLWVPAQVGFVVPVAGIWQVAFSFMPAVPANGTTGGRIYQAGAPVRRIDVVGPASTIYVPTAITAVLKCTAGQLIQLVGAVTPAGRGDCFGGGLCNWGSIDYLGTG